MQGTSPKHTNALAKESSPYLLQHAHNPVNWLPWGDTALEKAKTENKPMLVSIGYSSCHWCHVMERESFEDEAVAEVMNQNFICIKIDREERPDIDHIYMEAVQLMKQQGGWPLNCITTPDGKPVFGGTYFPKNTWVNILKNIADMWRDNPEKLWEYGDKVAAGMEITGGLPVLDPSKKWDEETLKASIDNWSKRFDTQFGGPDKAPKFPLPSNYSFLLHYGILKKDEKVLQQVELTLDKMERGGIFDQVGGGFARYSTDKFWKAPHFEKMLYDNAQLLGLYAEAYAHFDKVDYLEAMQGIKSWLKREMKHSSGGYFSAIDADSEGVEGLYYTWDKEILEEKSFSDFYISEGRALWEGRVIPMRMASFQVLAETLSIPEKEAINQFGDYNQKLLKEREKRIRPMTDDKVICSWNAMLAVGYLKSYRYTGELSDMKEAEGILTFIEANMYNAKSGELCHTWKDGKASKEGFLEDYAFTVQAYLELYQTNFDESVLRKAKSLAFTAVDNFYDSEKGLFYFTASSQKELIHRPVELSDNVIPASNSVMAHNLYDLAAFFDLSRFREIAERLTASVENAMVEYGEGYSHWADLYLKLHIGSPEIVVAGPEADVFMAVLKTEFFPLALYAKSYENSNLGIFEGRFKNGETLAYLCRHHSCLKPNAKVDSTVIEIKKLIASF